jgi:DNA modification methylase
LSDRVHNAQKPVEMVGNAIVNSTENKEVVVDLFGGSGTTMVACENTKRKCRMMEMEPKYCQVIIDRMLQLDNSLEVKINGEPYGVQD